MMVGVKRLIVLAVGLVYVNSQNIGSANPNARTLATGGTEFVVTSGGNPQSPPEPASGNSGSLLDLALATFGSSSDPNAPPPAQGTPQSNGGNFMDTVNNLLNIGTNQMDPNVLTSLGLPSDTATNGQPMNSGVPVNTGGIASIPADPNAQSGISGSIPVRDPNSVPLTDPNAGPVSSNSSPVRDPNAIGGTGGVVVQVDPQTGISSTGVAGDTGAVQYSTGPLPGTLPDPNTVGNVLDPNAPLPTDTTYAQGQPGIYPLEPAGGPSGAQPTGQPGAVGDLPAMTNGGPLDAAGNAGGPNGPFEATMPGANLASMSSNGPAGGPIGPKGGILSSLNMNNGGVPGPGMPSGPLAALKASSGAKKALKPPTKEDPLMNALIMSMLLGGSEMNPAMMAMAMSSSRSGNAMAMLPLLLSMNA